MYDRDGSEVWTRQFGSPAGDSAFGICADGAYLYVTGQTMGALYGQTYSGIIDAFLIKVATNAPVAEGGTLAFRAMFADPGPTCGRRPSITAMVRACSL